jgi:hypothetical protein
MPSAVLGSLNCVTKDRSDILGGYLRFSGPAPPGTIGCSSDSTRTRTERERPVSGAKLRHAYLVDGAALPARRQPRT